MAKRWVVASDHAGVRLKSHLAEVLRQQGFEVADLGCDGSASVDYPDYAEAASRKVAGGEADFGLLVCGTGIGMGMSANRVDGVRAAVCRSDYEAQMARAHNDANVLCLGERVTGTGLAEAILAAFVVTAFEGGRHQQRVEKMHAIERKGSVKP